MGVRGEESPPGCGAGSGNAPTSSQLSSREVGTEGSVGLQVSFPSGTSPVVCFWGYLDSLIVSGLITTLLW